MDECLKGSITETPIADCDDDADCDDAEPMSIDHCDQPSEQWRTCDTNVRLALVSYGVPLGVPVNRADVTATASSNPCDFADDDYKFKESDHSVCVAAQVIHACHKNKYWKRGRKRLLQLLCDVACAFECADYIIEHAMTLFDNLICCSAYRSYEEGILYLGRIDENAEMELLRMITTHTDVLVMMLACLIISTKFGQHRCIVPRTMAQYCTHHVRERYEQLATSRNWQRLASRNWQRLAKPACDIEEDLQKCLLDMERKVLNALSWNLNFATVSELSSIIINRCFCSKNEELYQKTTTLILQAKMEGCCDILHSCHGVRLAIAAVKVAMVDLQIVGEKTIEDAFQKCIPEDIFSAQRSMQDNVTLMDLCDQIEKRIGHKASLKSQKSEEVARMDSQSISIEWSRQILHLPYKYTELQVKEAYTREADKKTKAGESFAKVELAHKLLQDALKPF